MSASSRLRQDNPKRNTQLPGLLGIYLLYELLNAAVLRTRRLLFVSLCYLSLYFPNRYKSTIGNVLVDIARPQNRVHSHPAHTRIIVRNNYHVSSIEYILLAQQDIHSTQQPKRTPLACVLWLLCLLLLYYCSIPTLSDEQSDVQHRLLVYQHDMMDQTPRSMPKY